ncbi:hypothetical protein LINGRAHAP2_LOCUS1735, partial [Linum grandiflorum]
GFGQQHRSVSPRSRHVRALGDEVVARGRNQSSLGAIREAVHYLEHTS